MNDKDLERQKKLEVYQDKHGILTAEKRALLKEVQVRHDKIGVINKELAAIGQAIYDLKNIYGDTPHITDHAVVRYLERVKGLDIWGIKAEIMQYKKSVRAANTIVTVHGEEGFPDK